MAPRAAPPLLGLGVDAERVARFERHAAGGPWRISVWTRRELAHAAGRTDPALALCASFCCKEAVFKAAGGGVRFTGVELLARRVPATLSARLGPGAKAPAGATGARVRIAAGPEGEIVLVAALHGAPALPRGAWPWRVELEVVPLAEAAEGAASLPSLFSGTERAALEGRPAATVAGRIAAKRAIARALGCGDPAAFAIERERGAAPRLADPAPVLFSISHTRTHAYAVAAPA